MPSRELTAYRFQRSFYEAGKRLPQRTRALFYAGVLDYYFEGVEPDLPKAAADLFAGFKERVAMARTKALGVAREAASVGNAPSSDRECSQLVVAREVPSVGNAPSSGGVATGCPVGRAGVSAEYPVDRPRVVDAENVRSSGETSPEVQGSSPRDLRFEDGDGVLREGSVGAPTGCAPPLPDLLREAEEEVERAEAWELLEGDALERWLRGWARNGWVDYNGQPLSQLLPDWEGGGMTERWKLMLRGLCEKVKRDSERGGGSLWD